MIERVARRIGGFASSTAVRWANAVAEIPKEAILTPSRSWASKSLPSRKEARSWASKSLPSRKAARRRASKSLPSRKAARSWANKALPSRSRNWSSKALPSKKGALIVGAAAAVGAVALASSSGRVRKNVSAGLGRFAKRARSAAGSGNGLKNLSGKTKRELYRLAKRKNIPGRGSMSKQELERALT
jgi:hypothetical protein